MTDNALSLDVCRICLQNNGIHMVHIFAQPSPGKMTICEQIKKCTGIEIKEHSKLSSSICSNCITFLNISFKFRSMCWNSQSYLMEYVVHNYDNEQTCEQQNINPHNESDRIVHSTSQLDENENQKDLKNNTSMFLPSKNLSKDFYEDNWMDGECLTKSTTETTETNKEETIHLEMEKNDTIVTTIKTLGISLDGTAVIEEKNQGFTAERPKKEKRKHICDICGNIYDRRYSLHAHMRRHRDEKPYECELCGHAFHCNFELSRHIRKHTGLRPYVCDYCKRAFGDRSTLLKHIRIHRNERPYKCNTCGKSFTYSSVLKVHQLTHTGEKPYNCELCGKRFARSHHLRAHLETLMHQNDPKSKVLLKKIKRVEEHFSLGTEIFASG